MSTHTMSYRNRLVVYVAMIFTLFALISLLVGLANGERYKQSIMKSRLSGFAQMLLEADSAATSVMKYFPDDVRVTLIGSDGTVTFDSESLAGEMENHLDRPEIKECLDKGEGTALRRSDTSGERYFYYARADGGRVVRVAQNFDLNLHDFFSTDWMFLLFEFLLLVFSLFILYFLTERYGRKEEELADMETRRLKHDMTGNISHELKTPVSSIQGYLETIVNHPELSEERRRLFIERSYLQSLRLSDMITDISTITKLEEAPEQFKVAPVNIKVVFEEVLEEMSDSVSAHGISVENLLPPICVRGNYSLIYSIFRNLIENTMKYAGDGSCVHVSYSLAPDGTHCVDYHDTGRGVADDELDKIFERFYRLDADRGKPVGGSGLGLSIVRNAVLFHKGTIKAYRVTGGGLGFRFTLRDLK